MLLISTGVFLGLMGEQWRERSRHHEVAEASLRRFRDEILANRKAVAAVKDYHAHDQKQSGCLFRGRRQDEIDE